MPPKNKGLSIKEKRDRIMKIFTERKEVFSYPQLEKEAEKVGIRRDNVKEILESLLSDNLIETEALGTSRCYWSLPSQALIRLQQKCVEYTDKIEQEKMKQLELEQQYEQTQKGRENCEERSQLESDIGLLKLQFAELLKVFELKQRNDPERLQKLKQDTIKLKDEANQWTDDIIQLSFYLKSQAGMTQEQLDQLGIPNEIDNI